MCDAGSILHILPTVASIAAAATGNPELIPVIEGGGALGNSLASGQDFGQALTKGLTTGGAAFGGQELIGAGANALGVPGATGNSLTDLYGGTTDAGSLAGPGTIGGDISNGLSSLSKFSPGSGLSSLFGGTPQSTDALTTDYNAINSAAPASAGTVQAASTPNISLGNTLTTGANGIGSTAGGTLGTGGTEATAGENFVVPSSNGIGTTEGLAPDSGAIGGTSAFGATADNAAPYNPSLFSSNGNISAPATDSFSGVGGTQGGSTLSNLYNSAIGTPNVPSGSFNYDFSGNPVGASALSPSSPEYASTAGGTNMGTLGSLYGSGAGNGSNPSTGGAGSSVLNGLLRGGLGYLLNSPNTEGKNAINAATQQAEAGFAPYSAAGQQAENQLANLYGNNGSAAQTTAQQQFQNTPGYQFALNQGINAVNANAAAMGSPLTGNNQQAVNNYAQGTANQTYNNYVNELQNLASGGLSAAGGSGTAALTGGTALSQLGQNKANAANTAVGQGLSALFPSGMTLQQLLGSNNSANNNSGLLSLFQ